MTEGRVASEYRIVVGVDGSEPSQQALRWGAHLAATFGARLDAVTAWDYPGSYGLGPVPPPDWDPAQDMRKALDDTVQAVFGDQPPPA
jgi:nucleotide-binding universal stress UspA family protein